MLPWAAGPIPRFCVRPINRIQWHRNGVFASASTGPPIQTPRLPMNIRFPPCDGLSNPRGHVSYLPPFHEGGGGTAALAPA